MDVKGTRVLAVSLDGADAKALRETLDKLKDKLKSAVIVLGAVADGRVALIAGVTADLTTRVKAGELVNFVAQQVGGKGGGRPDMAQAGGSQPEKLPAALAQVKDWAAQKTLIRAGRTRKKSRRMICGLILLLRGCCYSGGSQPLLNTTSSITLAFWFVWRAC